MNLLIRILFAVFLFGASTSAFAETNNTRFFYLLYGYPKTERNCHIEARELAARFALMTGTTASGECKSISDAAYDIAIYYEADQQIPIVTTYEEVTPIDRLHIFKNQSACEQNLSVELQYFKEKTGLEPFLTFCDVYVTYPEEQSWAIRIDAFGESKLKPFWTDSFMLGKVDGMSETAAEDLITSTYRNAGVDVRLTNLRNDYQGLRQLAMLYYSDQPLNIKIKLLASNLDSREQCQAELLQLAGIVPENAPATTFCADNDHIQTFDVLGVVELGSWFKSRNSVETFKKYSDCAASREELLRLYRDTVGRNVMAGLCSRIDGAWRLSMLER